MQSDNASIIKYLEGTSKSEDDAAEKFGITEERVLEIMLDANLERCPSCDYWVECGELVDEDGEDQVCDSCHFRER